jgi:ribonuclease inhibitor
MIELVIPHLAVACSGWIDGDLIKSEQHFYQEIKKELQLPDYFGNNLDALYDVLTDRDFIQDKTFAVCFKSTSQLRQTLGEQKWNEILSIFEEAHKLYPEQIAFYILSEKD